MESRTEFLIAATKSGSGKTLLTLGILAALSRRGIVVQPFKCGPDFIDPTLHEQIVSRPSINLDLHMMGKEGCIHSYSRYSGNSEASVVEGVMGLFDGGASSSAALAETLNIPVVLVIDVRSAAESVAAVLKGFELYNPSLRICGVIFNRVGSERHSQLIRHAVLESCNTEILGFFPRDVLFEMPSRHLGLYMGHEVNYDRTRLDGLVDTIEQHIDIDRLLTLSAKADQEVVRSSTERIDAPPVRLAVARDEAFCFYYHENFDIFKECGFEIIPFSPLHDKNIPSDIDGIYLGGGYPELYAKQLSENRSMLQEIHTWAEEGGFIYGECGGFMYMTTELEDAEGIMHPMADIFRVSVKMKKRLSRLGYREVAIFNDCFLGTQKYVMFGHEFHYSDVVSRDSNLEYLYKLNDGTCEGCRHGNALGSYVHLHFAKTKDTLKRLHSLLRQNNRN